MLASCPSNESVLWPRPFEISRYIQRLWCDLIGEGRTWAIAVRRGSYKSLFLLKISPEKKGNSVLNFGSIKNLYIGSTTLRPKFFPLYLMSSSMFMRTRQKQKSQPVKRDRKLPAFPCIPFPASPQLGARLRGCTATLGKGSQKGSEKGACYGSYSKKGSEL